MPPEDLSPESRESPRTAGRNASKLPRISIYFFDNDPTKARWEFVSERIYQEDIDRRDSFKVIPAFHVRDQVGSSSFILKLEDGATFVEPSGEESAVRIDGTGTSNPITIKLLSESRVRVTWDSQRVEEPADWGRWIDRLEVELAGTRGFVHICFSYAPRPVESGLLDALNDAKTAEGKMGSFDSGLEGPEYKFSMRIDLDQDGVPTYPDLFDYNAYKKLGLPEGVHPDPTFVVNRRGKNMELLFDSTSGIFDPTEPNSCNPNLAEGRSLALDWRGVTRSRAEKECSAVSRDFMGSWCETERNLARLRWSKPTFDDDGGPKSVASFFFKAESAASQSPQGSLEKPRALIDPTIIYEDDEPPP